MKLSELGQISVSDGTMILIQLWDKSAVEMVSKEIESSDIGINPSIDGDTIRLVVPPLNEERRIELVKIVKKKSEDAKISIRNVRRNAMDEVKDLEKKGELSQDDSRRMQSDIQKNTDESIEEISQIAQNKENELMEV
jgi:ribosome recycling factor